jgi:FkbM family methyltransferase
MFEINELESRITVLSGLLLEDKDYFIPKWLREEGFASLKNKKIIICGSSSRAEIKTLSENANVIAIVDDEMSKRCECIDGIPLINTNEWINQVKKDNSIISFLLVMTLRATKHFLKQCIQHDLRCLTPIQFILLMKNLNIKQSAEGLIFRYGYKYFEFGLENIQELVSSKEIFSDEYSKLSYLNMIMYRMTLNPEYLDSIAVGRGGYYDYNTYLFEKTFLKFNNDEVYIDAGAYMGDSIEAFLAAVKGRFKHIYSFEPDLANNEAISNRIKKLQEYYIDNLSNKVTIIRKGLWSMDDELVFSSVGEHDLGGHLVKGGLDTFIENAKKTVVQVTSIDSSTEQDATFIKYEVEGAELEALKGAEKTISKNKPKLAVAVYHKPEDLLIIPNYIKNLNMKYKIGFRQHDIHKPDATYIYCY